MCDVVVWTDAHLTARSCCAGCCGLTRASILLGPEATKTCGRSSRYAAAAWRRLAGDAHAVVVGSEQPWSRITWGDSCSGSCWTRRAPGRLQTSFVCLATVALVILTVISVFFVLSSIRVHAGVGLEGIFEYVETRIGTGPRMTAPPAKLISVHAAPVRALFCRKRDPFSPAATSLTSVHAPVGRSRLCYDTRASWRRSHWGKLQRQLMWSSG